MKIDEYMSIQVGHVLREETKHRTYLYLAINSYKYRSRTVQAEMPAWSVAAYGRRIHLGGFDLLSAINISFVEVDEYE